MNMPETTRQPAVLENRLTFTGHIDADLYNDVKRYLVPPFIKLVCLCLLVLEAGIAVWGIVAEQNYGNLLLLVLMAVIIFIFYTRAKKNIVRNACINHPELTEGGMQVTITMGAEIKLNNHTSGSEHHISYREIRSMAETDKAIVCFTEKDKKRRYLLMPKNGLQDGQRDQIVGMIREHCGKLKKRW